MYEAPAWLLGIAIDAVLPLVKDSCLRQSNRLGNDISFSDAGGVEIEENWDRVKKITLDTEQPADAAALAPLLSTLPLELRPDMEAFIQACYEVSDCCWPENADCLSGILIPYKDKLVQATLPRQLSLWAQHPSLDQSPHATK